MTDRLELDAIRRDRAALERVLKEAGTELRGNSCKCPFHDDQTASAGVFQHKDGTWRFGCRGPCKFSADVIALTQRLHACNFPAALELLDVSGNGRQPPPSTKAAAKKQVPRLFQTAAEAVAALEARHGPRTALWTYRNAQGEPVGLIVRWNTPTGKDFRPVSRTPDGWIIAGMGEPRPLYGLPELLAQPGERVFVCEGEGKTDAARSAGLLATTSAHGCESPDKTGWEALAGRDVVILPDHDESGRKYAADVAGLLAKLNPAPVVKVVDLPDLPPKGDFVEHLAARRAAGLTDVAIRAEVEALADGAEPVKAEPDNSIPASKESERARIERFPEPIPASELGAATATDWLWEGYLVRRSVTLLTGLWKAGKTTLVAHLLREMGQGGELGGHVVASKALVVSEESSALWAGRRDALGIGDHVFFILRPFRGKPTFDQWRGFVAWLHRLVMERGFSVVILDPIATLVPGRDENDAATTIEALLPLYAIAEAGAGVLLVHHPRKGDAAKGQAARGSGALPGFVDVIVELRRHTAADRGDRRRVLTAYSRFDATPPEAVIELTEQGYRPCGTRSDTARADRMRALAEVLPSDAPGMTAAEVAAAWPEAGLAGIPRPGRRTLDCDLQAGAGERRWTQAGTGHKGDPFRYYLADSIRATTGSIGAGIASEATRRPDDAPRTCTSALGVGRKPSSSGRTGCGQSAAACPLEQPA